MSKEAATICPQCGKSLRNSRLNPARPFCSERCRLIDLGAWLDEGRRIAGDESAGMQEDFSAPDDSVRH